MTINKRGLKRFGKSAKKVAVMNPATIISEAAECRVDVVHECECRLHKIVKSEAAALIQNIESRYVDENGQLFDSQVGLVTGMIKRNITEWLSASRVGTPKSSLVRELAREIVKPMIRMLDAIEDGELDFNVVKKCAEVFNAKK